MTGRPSALVAIPELYAVRAPEFAGRAYFKVREVAELCDVPRKIVYELVRDRRLAALKLPNNGDLRIPREAIGLAPLERNSAPERGLHVYFAISADYRVKIGISTNVPARISGLQSGGGIALRLLGTLDGNHRTERALHKRFAAYRLRGEWFEPRGELRQYLHGLFGPFETGFRRD